MTNPNSQQLDERTQAQLDRYIDGGLTADENAAFEKRIEQEPLLRAELGLQQKLSDTLASSTYTAPQIPPALRDRLAAGEASAPSLSIRPAQHQASQKASAQTSRRAFWNQPALRWAAVFAFAFLAGVGLWLDQRGDEQPSYSELQYVNVASVYQQSIDAGFEPDWVCDNRRFTETIEEKLNVTLALAAMPTDRRMLGLSYVPRARADTVVMLGKFNEEPVLVFFDRPQFVEQFYDLGVNNDLNVHEREIAGLRVVEVSASPDPVFLNYLD